MTTKIKIIAGFTIMIILLGGMAIFGYIKIRAGSETFASYRLHAQQNTLSSDLSTTISNTLWRTRRFLATFDTKDVDYSLGFVDSFIKQSTSGKEISDDEWRIKTFEAMAQDMMPARQLLVNMRDEVMGVRKAYDNEARPAYNAMYKAFSDLTQIAYEVGNLEIVFRINRLWAEVTPMVTSLGRFSVSLDDTEAKTATERLNGLKDNIQELGTRLTTERGKQSYATLTENYKNLSGTLARMANMAAKADAQVDKVMELSSSLNKRIDEFSVRLSEEARKESDAVLAANDTSIRAMMILGVAGLLLGVALALFSVMGIVKVLVELSRFAGAIAEGDFDYQVRIHEKGEIGSMVEAMRKIPEVLKAIVEGYLALEAKISAGLIDTMGRPAMYSGGFSTLIEGTNGIMSSYLKIIDNIPTPVLLLSTDTKAEYMNSKAREVAGSDYRGKVCKQLFNREDDGTPTDALRNAIQSKHSASAETRAHPQGGIMDISYTAIPMLDRSGAVTSVLQLIADLTSIKETQRNIQKVASDAASISNRVAAASEELSAQVEQVSRGAEMQRERVESTASAMNEMNATVMEVARNAGQASEQSEGTRRKAEGGAELVNKVVRSINNVNAVATTLQDNMQELGAKAESVGGVMNVISDIADQTNLLALNAAIEAARAGEAGRGFAVVADEVRKLAEKTMSATQEVGGSITAIQQAARKNIEEVGTAAKSISEATDLANASGESLKEIVDLAAANSTIVASIATAAEEQSATSEEINSSIEEINRVVNETTQGMVQSSAAVQELSQMAQELRTVMEKLK
ncbi:MAG: methyl-accepting chemotaxis protein [Desulfovibrio sp.]|jgi:methyl-accepting chemotaxis protein|nr:methyl-accepting chemotaxis protein [Desulfovibrio sp.]